MDLKDSKTQKIALGVLAFFIVIYFWYSRMYTVHDTQLSLKQQEFETITTDLRNVEMKAKSLDALKIEYTQLVDRYHEIEELLPEVKQIPSFLVQLHTASSLTGTRITKLSPRTPESVDFYNVVSFEVEMTGTYHDFGSFISYVANFPFITNVSDVTVEATTLAISKEAAEKDKESRLNEISKPETIKATFVLSTYYVKENERLKEIEL